MNATNHTPTDKSVRPCPFCGGDDPVTVEFNQNDSLRETFIGCCSCGAKGPSTMQGEEKAVEGWNGRAITAPKRRPRDVLTDRDQLNIGDAVFESNIHIEHVLPLDVAPDVRGLSGGWEELAERLSDMDEPQLNAFFDSNMRAIADVEYARELSRPEEWFFAFRRIGGWAVLGSYATVGNFTLKEDGRFASCSVYCGIEREFIVLGETYKQAIAKAINEQRRYFKGELEKAREAAGYGRA